MGPYVREGYERGERLLQIIDARGREDHLARLQRAGVNTEQAIARGQMSVFGWEDTYLQGGSFDVDRMANTIEGVLQSRAAEGYPLARGIGNMEWILASKTSTESVLEYETRVSEFAPRYDDVLVCTYDINKFPANFLFDVLRTHPAAIIGGMLQENPFYVPPEQMLKELQARKRNGGL